MRKPLELSEAGRSGTVPVTVYEYTITVFPTSNLFKVSHQIRLEVASSNFPHYDRNLNTGARAGEERQSVYHDLSRPSHVVLPIMPAPIKPAAQDRGWLAGPILIRADRPVPLPSPRRVGGLGPRLYR